MAIKYPIYEMRDGKSPLSHTFFNPIHKDLDTRLDNLERVKISWDEAVRALREFGLERIDNSIIPVLQAAQAALAEAQGMVAELQQQIEDADVQGQLDTALAAQNAEVAAALDAQADAFTTALTALADDVATNDAAQTAALEAVDSAIQEQLVDLQALIYSAL